MEEELIYREAALRLAIKAAPNIVGEESIIGIAENFFAFLYPQDKQPEDSGTVAYIAPTEELEGKPGAEMKGLAEQHIPSTVEGLKPFPIGDDLGDRINEEGIGGMVSPYNLAQDAKAEQSSFLGATDAACLSRAAIEENHADLLRDVYSKIGEAAKNGNTHIEMQLDDNIWWYFRKWTGYRVQVLSVEIELNAGKGRIEW